jgi:pimeloyl-ACP methyl ester carboxylesterase
LGGGGRPWYLGTTLVDNSGHWLQQEQPAVLSRLLVEFLNAARKG